MEKPSFSRSKVEQFIQCPRCFYLDKKLGISQPPSFPFTLNNAVDVLLKKEFDYFREKQEVHHIVKQQGYDFIPFKHPLIDDWRSIKKGIRRQYKGYEFWGAIDDVWVNTAGELILVDYKATASSSPVQALNREYHDIYKRQIEFYQWLFRNSEFSVSDTAYFVYCTGNSAANYLNRRLEFSIHIIPHTSSSNWIEPQLDALISCYESAALPNASSTCKLCQYAHARTIHE